MGSALVYLCVIASQQDKEALDDLAMELELADEDESVMCVKNVSVLMHSIINVCF